VHKHFNACEQGRTAIPNEYLQQFTNYVDVITYSGGKVGTDQKTITMVATEMGLDHEKTNAEVKLKINAEVKEKYLAICFFLVQTDSNIQDYYKRPNIIFYRVPTHTQRQ